MPGHIEVEDPAASMRDYEEAYSNWKFTAGTVKKSNAGITSR
jgi:hypothetical protein